MALTRKQNWPELLSSFVEQRRSAPFEWGKNDCCLFACDGVLSITDIDLAAWFRDRYNSREGAYLALHEFAGGNVRATAEKIAAEHQILMVSPMFAQRGDVVLGEVLIPETLEVSEALGICVGAKSVFVTPRGLQAFPTQIFRMAWRI